MIKERYVNLDVAKLLRDKGFDEGCYGFYYVGGELSFSYGRLNINSEHTNLLISAPTQQVACDWVEETFNIAIDVWVGIIGYGVSISYALKDPNIASNDINHKDEMPCGDNSDGSWSSKELAYNEALKYVLTNLV